MGLRTKREGLTALLVGAVCWSCATTDARLGDVPSGPPVLTPSSDASTGADGGSDLEAVLMCVATECPAPYTTCPSTFGPTYKCAVDPRRDPKNCGACGKECLGFAPIHMTSRCVDGACALECESLPTYVFPDGERATNFKNCNGILDDGCEVDLFSDRANCGACGNACSAGQRCIDGVCGCPPGLTDCSGFCIDITSNESSCGACGNECEPPPGACDPRPANADYGCEKSTCGKIKCFRGFADCDADLGLGCASNGCETSTMENANCGACGKACKADEACVDDGFVIECRPSCEKSGKTTCPSGACADTLNDPDSCGGCGLSCPSSGPKQQRSCNKGVCMVACVEGFGDCNGDPSDGCETDLRVHPSHCGACGVSCDLTRGQPCVEAKCLVAPCEDRGTK